MDPNLPTYKTYFVSSDHGTLTPRNEGKPLAPLRRAFETDDDYAERCAEVAKEDGRVKVFTRQTGGERIFNVRDFVGLQQKVAWREEPDGSRVQVEFCAAHGWLTPKEKSDLFRVDL